MAHHVSVGEVDQAEPVGARRDAVAEQVADAVGAHGRLQVVGGHVARRVDKRPALALAAVLTAAVEEVGDVRVLLRLGHVQLRHAA